MIEHLKQHDLLSDIDCEDFELVRSINLSANNILILMV